MNFPKNVLIVDDDPIQRAVLDQIFATHGSEAVEAAADGLKAISAIEGSTEPFDLIVLDLHMPNYDGIELISYLESQNVKAAVLLMSSLPEAVVRMSSTLAEVSGLRAIGSLQKPILLDDLLAIIAAQNWSRKKSPKFVRDDIAQSRHAG